MEQFNLRAQTLVQAFHAAQTDPAWNQGFVPLSDVTRLGDGDPAFTVGTRETFASHTFNVEGALSSAVPPAVPLSFPDGTAMTVDLLDAASAFHELGRPRTSDSDLIHDRTHLRSVSPLPPITITGATLGQMRLRTNHGEINAPAWLFTTKELRVTIVRLAVALRWMTLLTLAGETGNDKVPHDWASPIYVDRFDETHLSVVYWGGGGESAWRATAYETADEVVIGVAVTHYGGTHDMWGCNCATDLELAAPLGKRTVLGIGGYVIPVGVYVQGMKLGGQR